jgi:hypothetical protein
MNQSRIRQRSTITINRAVLAAVIGLSMFAAMAIAHGGLEHVTGTVAKISATSVTVKTTAGKMVDVAFDAKTTFSRNDQPMEKTAIKVGDRVVIHAEEVNEKLVAHTVQIGAAAPASHN